MPDALIIPVFAEFAPAIIALQKRSEPLRNPAGALHAPAGAGQERGDPPVYVMHTSAYTRATLRPLSTTIATGLAAAATLVTGGKRAKRQL